VLAVEHRIYPIALELVAAGKVSIVDGHCRIAGAAEPTAPLISPSTSG
jgi:phosphoribosylglycinamide formyltransferase-1